MSRIPIAVGRFLLAAAIVTIEGPPVLPVEPGVDIAAPRVAVTVANGTTLKFVPASVVVEQSDYVRWNNTTGLHSTTSGSACVASGLWNAPLNATTTTFTRAFNEDPATFPYFCTPHCGFNMTGQVVVTTPIDVTVTASGTAVQLNWTGGGGLYRIYRSTSPLFTSATTTVLTGTGTQAVTFTDQAAGPPPVGTALYYLVMNQF